MIGRLGERIQEISWIVPGRLGAMGYPSAHRDMRWLAGRGVTAVLSLTEDAASVGTASRAAGLRWLHIPLKDFHAPTLENLAHAVSFIEAEHARGGVVVVHCHAGLGRTGTVLAAYLVSRGMTPEAAMRHIRDVRPGSIETGEQERRIEEFYRARRSSDRR